MKNIFSYLMIGILLISSLSSYSQIEVLSGTENGTYIALAKDMNKLLPKKSKGETEVDFLNVKATKGSSFNFDLLADANHPAKAAFMQLDLLLLKKSEDMLNGTKKTENLIVLMPMNTEEIHLVSKVGSHINSLNDLSGKTVGIGNNGEGTYSTAIYLQNASKLDWRNKNLSTQDAMKALLLDKIDAFFVVAAAPYDMIATIPVNFPLKMELSSIENVNGWADYYTPITMEAGTYPWQKEAVSTFGVPSVIVVNKSKLSEEDLADLKLWKSTTIENLESLKTTGHSSWKTANPAVWNNSVWTAVE